MTQEEVLATLQRIDWEHLEEEVTLAIEDALNHYSQRRKGSSGLPICQLALIIDPLTRITSVHLESAAHAKSKGGMIRRGPDGPIVERIGIIYPTEFDFQDYHCVYHSCLVPLIALDLEDEEQFRASLEVIEGVGLRARETAVVNRYLERVEIEFPFHVGSNSPREWHDNLETYHQLRTPESSET